MEETHLCDSEVGEKVGYGGTNNEKLKQERYPASFSSSEGYNSTERIRIGCLDHCQTKGMENDPLFRMKAEKTGDVPGYRTDNPNTYPKDKTASQDGEHSLQDPAQQPKCGEMESGLWLADRDDNLCESPGKLYEPLPDFSCLGISSSMDNMSHCPPDFSRIGISSTMDEMPHCPPDVSRLGMSSTMNEMPHCPPDFSRLGISSTMNEMPHYPYEDCIPSEFVMMGDFVAAEETQLSLSHGDRVLLLSAVTSDWWWVEHNGRCGYVPASHLHRIDEEEDTEEDDPWQDEEYYGSYKTLKLHLEMLSDRPRTDTYRNVILQNSSALKGKQILDLGCGTGIISFFCAQLAQPDIVYAVEASEIAEQTSQLVEENGFSGVVKVIRQRAEELKLPSRVDVLVSEWMGTCLVFEFMLESVLLVRDLWLEEGGMMWPSTASIHMVPCSAEKEYANKVLFWDSPYGLDFKMLKPMAVQEFLSKPKPDYVLNPEDCLSEPCALLDVNMKTLKIEDLEKMSGHFAFHVKRDGIFHGFTIWFSVQFQNLENQEQTELSTGPFNPLTHWKHTLFMMDEPVNIKKGDKIEGSVIFHRNPNWRRHLSVTLSWSITEESATTVRNVGCKVFPLWR